MYYIYTCTYVYVYNIYTYMYTNIGIILTRPPAGLYGLIILDASVSPCECPETSHW